MNTLLIKLAIAAIIALGLFGSGGWLAWKYQAAQVAAKQDRIEQLSEVVHELQTAQKRSDAALASARTKKEELRKLQLKVTSQLNSSLIANREWADTPVPKEVQDVLQ